MIIDKPDLLCIAHRGAMGHEPENTLASIRKAMELGASCIEIDAYYVDKHLVVFHDDRLERTTNGTGYLCDQSFEELRTLDAGNGQQIPTHQIIMLYENECVSTAFTNPVWARDCGFLLTF